MRIELISTGDEVITGSIDDTNASFLSRELIDAGLQVDRRHTCGDSLEELMAVISEVSKRNSIVIVTGGLGPTNDDLTTEAAARVAGMPLELNEQWLERMRYWFEQRGRTMAKSNLKQAMLPQGSLFINNPIGTACGFILKIDQALFIFCPGVPKELKAMWESSIKDMVISFTRETIPRTHLIRLFLMGIGESNLAELLSKLEMPQGITLGDRAIYPLIELKLIGHDASDSDMFLLLDELMAIVSPYYVCRDSYTLLEQLTQKEIKLGPINAVDGLCRGWFLIHLQELFTNFVTCSVLNTDENTLTDTDNDLRLEKELLEHVPAHNKITLLPVTDESKLQEITKHEKAAVYPHHYELSYHLDFTEHEHQRSISGDVIISFKDNVYKPGSYTRNRDFLAHLCCVELYKALVREPLITPEDCAITVLAQSDSMPHPIED